MTESNILITRSLPPQWALIQVCPLVCWLIKVPSAAATSRGRRHLQTHCRLPCNKMEDTLMQGARWAIRRTNSDGSYRVYTYPPAPALLHINQAIHKWRYDVDKLLTLRCNRGAVIRESRFFCVLLPSESNSFFSMRWHLVSEACRAVAVQQSALILFYSILGEGKKGPILFLHNFPPPLPHFSLQWNWLPSLISISWSMDRSL